MALPDFAEALEEFNKVLRRDGLPLEKQWVTGRQVILSRTGFRSRSLAVYLRDPGSTTEQDMKERYLRYGSECDPLVFYVIGVYEGRTLCTLLGDIFPPYHWEPEDYPEMKFVYRKDWNILFFTDEIRERLAVAGSWWQWQIIRLRSMNILSNLDYMLL